MLVAATLITQLVKRVSYNSLSHVRYNIAVVFNYLS